jgi:acyl-CoA dehydrogenase
MHALIHYNDVRVPAEGLLGGEGQAFVIAQTRLGGGRVHHAMRTVGMARRALDMLAERAVSRRTRDGVLADKQSVRDYVADSYIELTQFRLLVMYVAWCIDQGHDPRAVRRDIAAIKVLTPQILHDVTQRAIQVHGALGVSDEMPLGGLWMTAPIMGLVDGPTEVHRNTVARQVLKGYTPVEGLWPSQHQPTRIVAARRKYADHPGALKSAAGAEWTDEGSPLEHEVGNQ